MSDNNMFALAMCMAIPLLVGVAMTERLKLLKIGAGFFAVCSVLAVAFTFSRGGLLTLGVVALVLLLRSGRPVLAVLVLGAGITAFFLTTNQEFQESYFGRAGTISTFEEDASAMGRIVNWQRALRIWEDYPVFGVGPDNIALVYREYSESNTWRVTHNTYLQLLAECGAPALVLFLALISTALFRLQRLRKRSKCPATITLAVVLHASLIAFLVGSIFVDRAFSEFKYMLIALSACLERLPVEEEDLNEQPEADSRATPWWRNRLPSTSQVQAR